MQENDILIIGAGVVGLAIAARIMKDNRSVYIVERHDAFGRETSSRNSEVMHAGIYYKTGSLKAKLCIEGNKKLYEICAKNRIPHKRIEKLIIATNVEEEADLEELFECGKNNGADDLRIISGQEAKKMEPNIKARSALYSPSTGIIDSHSFMKYLEQSFKSKGGEVAYNCDVVGLRKINAGYEVRVRDSSGEAFTFNSHLVVNSAGLEADAIAKLVGIDIQKHNYSLKYCKGQYFRVNNSRKSALIGKLIYPVPHEKITSLGVHATKDLTGGLRLGPDANYISRENINYDVDLSQRKVFLESASRFLPFLKEEDLVPDTAGIRPKLQGSGDNFRDFVIKEESGIGFPGLVNLIGIESPGLTSAPAIARYVESILR